MALTKNAHCALASIQKCEEFIDHDARTTKYVHWQYQCENPFLIKQGNPKKWISARKPFVGQQKRLVYSNPFNQKSILHNIRWADY